MRYLGSALAKKVAHYYNYIDPPPPPPALSTSSLPASNSPRFFPLHSVLGLCRSEITR